nr:ovomucoid-like [Onthophagus taurus]
MKIFFFITVFFVIASINALPSTTREKRQSNTFQSCFDACKDFTTREYNPICASDDVTYNNRGAFNCAQRCNEALTISFFGTCQPL